MPVTQRNVPASERVADAYERLRDLIATGRLAPGAPLIETEIASSLGIKRSHLRSALQRLQQTGFVISSTIGTYSRSRVAPLTLDDVQELFTLVGSLEGIAARNAAQLPRAERTALVREMKRLNTELLAAAQASPRDPNRANDLDVEFHRQYVQRAAGPRVLSLHEAVKPQAERYERLYTSALIDQIALSVAEHEAIIAAIAGGDSDAAQYAVEINWRNAAERFRRIMETAGERGNL